MRITILQQDIAWGDPKENCSRAENVIRQYPGSDLYVLPEMFSTGFATKPQGIAERDSYSLSWMKRTAHDTRAAIAGSIAVEEGGRFYNRFCFVKPDGSVAIYDKHHLFTYGGEDKEFTAGGERVVVEWKGFRILLEICYDLRFPVWSRNRGDYDLIIYVASWPTTRQSAWDALLRARAIENQCFLVGVNRVGKDPACEYAGGSVVLDAFGETIAACEKGKECTATAEINMDTLLAFREKFPVLNDADDFSISNL